MPYLLFHYPGSRGSWGYIWVCVRKERETHRHREKKYIKTTLLKIHFKKLPMAHGTQTSRRVSMRLIQMERCSSGILNLPNGPFAVAEAPCGCLVFELWSGLWMTWSKPPCISIKASFPCFLNSSDKTKERQGRRTAWVESRQVSREEQYLGVTPRLPPCQSGEWLFHSAWKSLPLDCWWMVYGQMEHTETGKMAHLLRALAALLLRGPKLSSQYPHMAAHNDL